MDLLLEATRRAEQRHFWFKGFRRFVRPLVVRALEGVPAPEILDCGCGTGANLLMLGEFGRASGFDLSWDGLEFAHEYGQRRVVHASITEIPFASNRFDLATAFDVLYSLPGEAEGAAVRELYRVVRPGGYMLANVAALNILRGNHSIFGGEVRRSSRRRLRRVLSEGGFEIVRLTYTNFTLFPLMLAVRAGQRLIGLAAPEEAGTDIAVPPKPVNAALAGLLALEAAALRKVDMPVGSSLLCLARKPRG